VIPAEHGAWSWLLVPFITGALVSGSTGASLASSLLPLTLTLVGGLCAFVIRQPAAAWLRMRRGRTGRADEALAAGWTLGLAAVAAACLAGLLMMGRASLVWLIVPFAAVLALYLLATRRGRAAIRAVWMEVIGAVGLALMAPAAIIAATGEVTGLAWAVWVLMGVQNALGALYARLRVADTHGRPVNRDAVLWSHVAGFAAVLTAGLLDWIPLLAAVPFAGFLARAVWAVRKVRPVANVRRLGFTEVGVELLSGLWIAASYWLW